MEWSRSRVAPTGHRQQVQNAIKATHTQTCKIGITAYNT